MNWAKGSDENGRPVSNNLIPDEKRAAQRPRCGGGTNWYSPSYDPATNMVYFRSLEACSLFQAKTEPFEEGRAYYSTGARRPMGNPPNMGYINAFDLNKKSWILRGATSRSALVMRQQGVMSTAGGLVAFGNDAEEFEIDDAAHGKAAVGL